MPPDPEKLPNLIFVDLDGTLVRTDTLAELVISAARKNFGVIFQIPWWLLKGRAVLKDELARRALPAVELLPYNLELIEYLRRQKAAGRELILATASHRRVARAVADHLGLFSRVVASDRGHNLRGRAKADRLAAEAGGRGFAYAGNDASDLHVWGAAETAIVVNAPGRVRRRIPCPVELEIAAPRGLPGRILKALRIHQWVKNTLVILPAISATTIHEPTVLVAAAIAFLCFGLVASATYVMNDLADLEADRRHPSKHKRPFAGGDLPLAWALALGPLPLVSGLALAYWQSGQLAAVLVLYLALTMLYTVYIKSQPIIDVFWLAGLYSLRVIAGAVVTGILPSIWLLSFTGFFFLSLGFIKRFVEVSGEEREEQLLPNRGYYSGEEMPLITMGLASSFAASIVLAIYVEQSASETYAASRFIWGFVPLTLFWQCRQWLSAFRGYVDDDPLVYAARDWVSWSVLAVAVLLYTFANGWTPGI